MERNSFHTSDLQLGISGIGERSLTSTAEQADSCQLIFTTTLTMPVCVVCVCVCVCVRARVCVCVAVDCRLARECLKALVSL